MSNEANMFQYTQPELAKINDMVDEAVAMMVQIESLNQSIKDIGERAKNEFKLPASKIKSLANQRFNGKAARDRDRQEEIIEFEEELFTAGKNAKRNISQE